MGYFRLTVWSKQKVIINTSLWWQKCSESKHYWFNNIKKHVFQNYPLKSLTSSYSSVMNILSFLEIQIFETPDFETTICMWLFWICWYLNHSELLFFQVCKQASCAYYKYGPKTCLRLLHNELWSNKSLKCCYWSLTYFRPLRNRWEMDGNILG